MVIYDCDINEILVEPIRNSQSATIRNAFLNIHKVLTARGIDPKVYILENDCSGDLKEAMKKYEIDFQLAPQHIYRQNAA